MLDQLRRVIFRWRVRPQRVIADTTYGTIDNIRALEGEEDIRAYVPLPDWEHKTAYYGPGQCRYDAGSDVYVCPEGTPLHPYRRELKAEKVEYRAEAAICNACPMKAECTPSNQGRQVHRSFHAPSLERVRGYHKPRAIRRRCASARSGSSRAPSGQLRGGETVARDAPVPLTGFAEGEHGRTVHRGGTESQTVVERDGLGTAPLAGGSRRFRRCEGLELLSDRVISAPSESSRTAIGDSR
jgi:hypothetical protein